MSPNTVALKMSPERTLSGKLYVEMKRSIVVSLGSRQLKSRVHGSGFTQASEVLVHSDRCIPCGVDLYSSTVALEHEGIPVRYLDNCEVGTKVRRRRHHQCPSFCLEG